MGERVKFRVVNKKRFMLFMFVVFVIFFIAIRQIILPLCANSQSDKEYNIVYAKRGDSLWSIASKNNYNNSDLRELIYTISKENNIENSSIYEGQPIKIPLK